MAEERIFIDSGEIRLEGLLENVPGEKGLVMTHPHPLYGGEMGNNVVEAVVGAYREQGYSTLRFNFRGVGASEGEYDNGIGEQEDVGAALATLHGLGKKEIDLGGYSFGAWVNARGLEGFEEAGRLIMVSPPVSFMDFSFLKYNPKIRLVIAASRDEIADCGTIGKMMPKWNPEAVLRIIEGSDHFYWNSSGEIKGIVREFLEVKE
jgi:alpha/beta superfamily hydrolase